MDITILIFIISISITGFKILKIFISLMLLHQYPFVDALVVYSCIDVSGKTIWSLMQKINQYFLGPQVKTACTLAW